MKIAIVGSGNITVSDIGKYISNAEEIVSGGAVGVDSCVAKYAKENGISLTEFLPQYERYGRAAPIVRNKKIVDHSDKIIAFWDGKSKGTLSVIKYAQKTGKPCEIIICK
jgi:predicted Rossmann fold nucleotide-binding protein DprA/Smf involved in DNA uptake